MGDVGWETKLLEAIETDVGEVPEIAADVSRAQDHTPSGVDGFVVRYLEGHGLFPFAHDGGAARRNVLARLDGDPGRADRHLVLSAYSRIASADDAARLASVLWVAGLLARLRVPLAGPLTVLVVGDDPEGTRGVPWVLDRDLIERPSAALVADVSSPVYPGIGELGRCQFEVRCTECRDADPGAPAHSVIEAAATAVLALRDIARLRSDVPRGIAEIVERSGRIAAAEGDGVVPGGGLGKHFDHVDVNIGTIHGGTAIDAKPGRCVVGVDCGLPFGIDRSRVLRRASDLLAEASVRADVVERGTGALASLTAPGEPVARSLLGAVRDVLDPRAHGVVHRRGGDARWFRERAVPTVQYGPADGYAHDAAKVYALTVLRYLRTR